jgi:hypothetical protein
MAISVFLFVAARAEWKSSEPQPHLLGLPAFDVSRSLPAALGARASVADVDRALALNPTAPLVPLVDGNGAISAMASRSGVGRIPPAQRAVVPATSIAEPLVSLPKVSPEEPISSVLERLGSGISWWALVPARDGSLRALVSSDVDHLLEVARG